MRRKSSSKTKAKRELLAMLEQDIGHKIGRKELKQLCYLGINKAYRDYILAMSPVERTLNIESIISRVTKPRGLRSWMPDEADTDSFWSVGSTYYKWWSKV